MKKFILTALSLALMVGFAHAEEGEGGDNYVKPIRAGRGALVFTMGGLMTSTPGNMDGIGAGARYMLSPAMTLRAGFGLRNFSDEFDPDNGDSTQNKNSTWAVEGALEFVLRKKRNMMFYAGPLLQVGGQADEPDGDNNDTDISGYTVAGIAGVNWFFVENLSVGAEYRLGLTSETTKTEAGERTQSTIGVGSAAFLVSFWF